MRIAVIGAGIAGLVTAAGLQRDGHDVEVHEQRDDPSPVGAGLTLFRNAFEALDLVGLGDAVREVTAATSIGLRAGQRQPSGRWLITLPPAVVESMRTVHRVDLHRALADQLAPGTLHLGSPMDVRDLSDEYDLVVAADGIRSRARTALGLDTGLRYSGFTAWRGVTDEPVDLRGEAGETWGRGRLFGYVPLPDQRIYWFGTALVPAGDSGQAGAAEHAAVRAAFADWHAPIPQLIAATDPATVLRHDIHDLARPLDSFVRGRTVLVGDAAHAMTPNLGQGAGQGIEDATVLTVLLRDATTTTTTTAAELAERLDLYDVLRRPRTTSILRRSRLVGRVAHTSHPAAVGLRDLALRLTPGSAVARASARLQNWPHPEG